MSKGQGSSPSGTAIAAARKEGVAVETLPQSLTIVDCEKRRGVSRYYAYVIEVTRLNGEVYHIYRRYRKFHKMVQRLEERFPIEAGNIRASDRIIPQLPGKKYIGRSAVRDVAELRMPYLDEFLKKLYAMSDKIRYDSIVLGFLKPNYEDIEKPYKPSVSYPGRTVSQPEKPNKPPRPTIRPPSSSNEVKPLAVAGPVPTIKVMYSASNKPTKPPPPRPTPPRLSPAKPPPPAVPSKGPRGKVLYNYSARYDDELSLTSGSNVILIRKLDGDWYEGKVNGKVGLVPGNYLKIIEPLPDDDDDDDNDSGEETDEWDDDSTGKINCHYKGRKMLLEVDSELVRRPTFHKLLVSLRAQLKDTKIAINYKDSSGDLIEVVDDSDLLLMKDDSSSRSTGRSSDDNTAPWTLYITRAGDHSVYNTTMT
ncbi:PREDICTED: neutrophil cytosol factor 4-like [Amphimedon queenslandica]|uniref:Uncharacterized protein n=2 Tax=Amphimedon queenslandica TaxID=400682 RepID=A0AAN0J6X3_AMPQE|nr:PREDICTED: neutrophil cytosol factor 4-like [Amphimedon queenslandica]|eukprot:XP_019852481.1 PREDICTED: neutrophil cytosol factor 4-like [Amphimedon queenslandica]